MLFLFNLLPSLLPLTTPLSELSYVQFIARISPNMAVLRPMKKHTSLSLNMRRKTLSNQDQDKGTLRTQIPWTNKKTST